ncbi:MULTISPECIES: hypothetical protein [Bacillus amyloliquefaciens group]|uniref:hypothetical protein n=1 Tax=Bacillus amyloliquefaciens group TaxID=1938374 RepID=UPI000A9900FD|nr:MULTISPECIES: hypothetical protein [Bacillus amyloliquefaciens group]
MVVDLVELAKLSEDDLVKELRKEKYQSNKWLVEGRIRRLVNVINGDISCTEYKNKER